MADRQRSQDGKQETKDIFGVEGADTPDQQGSSGGNMARQVAGRDEEKRATVRPAGKTRVKGTDNRHEGLDENTNEGGV